MTYEFKIGTYKTRDGREARVLCTDAPGEWPIIGYYIDSASAIGYYLTAWMANGHSRGTDDDGIFDLMPPREVAWTIFVGPNEMQIGFKHTAPHTHRITYYTDGECTVEKL